MIGPTYSFIDLFFQEHKVLPETVLEVGSLDVNGNCRQSFETRGITYTGIDFRPGANVDLVVDGHDIKKEFKEGQFDMVICFDTLEHDRAFWITMENMAWVLKKGGWLLLGAPSIRHPRHMHPNDYWRFFDESFKELFEQNGLTDIHVTMEYYDENKNDSIPDQVYGWAKKP